MDEWFRSDTACREYIRHLRWPDGFVCPHCGWNGEPWMTSRGLLHCRGCQGQTSLTAGTIFQDTRKPLRMWFMAMWYVTNQKNGVSALGLQRVLGLGSYETAWTWLHKLRQAMVRPGRDSLCGTVEVDETYVGGAEKGKRGRETETKAIVAVAAEENDKGIGRIRLRRVNDVSGASLLPFVQSAVMPGAVVHTDGWSGYSGLTAAGYKHEVTVVSAGIDLAHVVMPRAITSPRFSSGGCSARIKAVSSMCISTTTLTSSLSGSIGADRKHGACYSTGSLSKPLPSGRPPTTQSSATRSRPDRPPHWSEGDTLFLAKAFGR